MWKNFFYYSKSERRVVLLLLALLLALLGAAVLLRNTQSAEVSVVGIAEADSFLSSIKDREAERAHRKYVRQPDVPKQLSDFDPNLADSIAFRRLGLSAFIAHNILRYRAKGGVFRTPDAFSKMYGLSAEQYQELKPYLYISEQFQRKERVVLPEIHRDTVFVSKYAEGVVLDLNKADTAELKRVPGIGSGLARMIVAYRERLGGFHNVGQLSEVEHVPADAFRWFAVKTPLYRKIAVNKDGLDKLRNHPYMNFYRAKVIVEYRRKRGKIKNLSQLSMFDEFAGKDFDKLSPYLSFD